MEFVCERGYQFEEDPSQENVFYTCQEKTEETLTRGFFDSPLTDEEWPRCVEDYDPPCIQNIIQGHTYMCSV